jgi:nicotinate phosphoribosyltransferase
MPVIDDEPAVVAMTDDDMYKFTMSQGYGQLYPDVEATSEFNNRCLGDRFTPKMVDALREEFNYWESLRLTEGEEYFIRKHKFYKPHYIEWLKNFRYNRDEITMKLDDGRLFLQVHGKLPRQTMYEVKVMAAISKNYFKHCVTDWNYELQESNALMKAKTLAGWDCVFTDFGTRRRRSFRSQDTVVRVMSQSQAAESGHFVGTSNIYLAMKYGTKAIGTVAHEWFMAHSALMGLRHANRFGMEAWVKVYDGSLGTLLTDTYGTDSCLRDFNTLQAKLWDGVRHDSGDPFVYTDKMVAHYKSVGVNPLTKHIVYSNALDLSLCRQIRQYCEQAVIPRFGIGTYFTNDYTKASDLTAKCKPLNIVIKLRTVDGIEVVKLSDDMGKSTGERDAVRIAQYMHRGIPLDAN